MRIQEFCQVWGGTGVWVGAGSLALTLILTNDVAAMGGGAACNGTEAETSRLFLEQVSATSAIVSWRGAADALCIGEDQADLTQRVDAVEEGGHQRARLTGLKPETVYHYSIGAAAVAGPGQAFRTPPRPGESPKDGNVHIWVLGDSGTAAETNSEGNLEHPGEAEAVRDGYFKYNRDHADSEVLDLVLFLGDTAYPDGTDEDWQNNFFAIYPNVLRSTYGVHTIGNHEMGQAPIDICMFIRIPQCDDGPFVMPIGGASMSSDPMSYDGDGDGQPDGTGPPYLDIFTLPAEGQLGGVASGTELYYSIDYGNVHVVSLDSMLSVQDPGKRQAMRDWLVADLKANTLDWTVVIFHHPVYSKGQNHDSDVEEREIVMRETFVPVFDAYGVDVVLNGHAHSYERSWYITGHTGLSHTFDAALHAELGGDGYPTLGQTDDPYPQISDRSQADDKVVYVVAGNAGHVTFEGEDRPCPEGRIYGCRPSDWLQHPAHRTFDKLADDYMPNGIFRLGSVVLDATADSLTTRFIDDNGEVLDYLIIRK